MSISPRQVKNKRDSYGKLTGKSGTVYDVIVKCKTPNGYKNHMKRGFITQQTARQYEADIRAKFNRPSILAALSTQGHQSVHDYLLQWLQKYGSINLRPSTYAGYKCNIVNHIIPIIGHLQLKQLTPETLDDMYRSLFEKGLSSNSVKYCHRVLSVALESARKYHYIEYNPCRDIITKFGASGEIPAPYTVAQMQRLMAGVIGTEWEMIIMLGGLYGLRISETIGLRWGNVDLNNLTFQVKEQLPFGLSTETKELTEMAPVKSYDRSLPITDDTLSFFKRQLDLQARRKRLAIDSGSPYYDNQLVIAKPDGSPYRRESVSDQFGVILKRLGLPHIRFHDLRHTAATNMHQLTGDFYTVGQILGHSLKGIGNELGVSGNIDSVTARYVDVRLERKKAVLDTYHQAIFKKQKKPHNMER